MIPSKEYDKFLNTCSSINDFLKFNETMSFGPGGLHSPDALCELWNTHPSGLPGKTADDFRVQVNK